MRTSGTAPEPVLRYGEITGPVARFAADLELRGLRPVAVSGPARLRGVALASDAVVAGYVRDEHCVAPEWPGATVPPLRIRVEAELPGATEVDFLEPRTAEIVRTIPLTVKAGALEIALPAFREDLAFRIQVLEPSEVGTVPSSQ